MDDNLVTANQTTEEVVITESDNSGASVLLNLESLIRSHLNNINLIDEELRKHSDMLNDIFENDPTFKDHSEKAKEATRVKTATKQQILKQPAVAELSGKIKNMKEEKKDLSSALSDYLQEYQRMSGLTEIEGDDGELRQIIYTAKLIRKTSFNDIPKK